MNDTCTPRHSLAPTARAGVHPGQESSIVYRPRSINNHAP